VRESGLVRNRQTRKLSREGEALLRHQDTEALPYAFETWASQGKFDELSRIPAIKGQKSRYTRLTPPAMRHEAIVEALSWCPTEGWISVSDFMRALKIWHFDFELDLSDYSGLYVGDSIYGRLTESGGWTTAKRLYVNAVLWEYLGSIGALDLLYLPPDEAYLDFEYHDIYDEYYSLYNGLAYFRINPPGAYLLGQADEYVPSHPTDAALFSIDPTLVLTLKDPSTLTPNLLNQLAQFTVEEDREHYRLYNQQVLNALKSGSDLEQIADFLVRRHEGPLPKQITDWLEEVKANSRAVKSVGKALFIRASSQALLQLATEETQPSASSSRSSRGAPWLSRRTGKRYSASASRNWATS
jgi:hypothetical protein